METIELKTITAKQLIKTYSVTGTDLFEVRRMLELLDYLEPVRFGSQTYWLKKPLPTDAIALRSEYTRKKFVYVLPDCYPILRNDLYKLYLEVEKTSKRGWGGQFGLDIAAASFMLCLAYNLLPPTLSMEKPCVFICIPPHDAILDPKIGRQKRLDNMCSLLDSIKYHVSKYRQDDDTILGITMALNTMLTIRIPNRLAKCAV